MTTDSVARGRTPRHATTVRRRAARIGIATLVATALAVPVATVSGGAVAQAATGASTKPPKGAKFGGHIDEFDLQDSPALGLGRLGQLVQADKMHKRGFDGTGVDVALIDTGVTPVAGLAGSDAVAVGPDLSFDAQGTEIPLGTDAFGHGTHMASIIARRGNASTQGIAPGARILDMKVGAANGAVDVSQVIAAVNWVDQHRNDPGMDVRVINLSYGTDSVQPYQLDPLAHAVESAWRHGIVVVVAAGNTGGALTNPAIDPYVLTVGAADTGDPSMVGDDRTADFSAIGTDERRVDVIAPGVSIAGARVPGSLADIEHPEARVNATSIRGSGTSQAAAVVSGAVALLLDARPSLTPDQVKQILTKTAVAVPGSPATTQGAGMIRIDKAHGEKPKGGAQTHPISTGLGSLDAARGTFRLVDGDLALAGEVDVMGAEWDAETWAAATTGASTWDGGTWNGNVWTGDTWEDGVVGAFTGRTWRGATWTGRTWRGEAWAGRTWRGAEWSGRTWRWH